MYSFFSAKKVIREKSNEIIVRERGILEKYLRGIREQVFKGKEF